MYIQNFSEDTDYSYKEGTIINSSLANTGTNGDELCKINDMASNTYEWTTEYSNYASSSYAYPCTTRGSSYVFSNVYTINRDCNDATNNNKFITFRLILYI